MPAFISIAAGGKEFGMAQTVNGGGPREAFTFDDVLLKPALSDVLPSEVDVGTRITRDIFLNIPIVASAMDTVTEAAMAIAMAQAGGIGVIHRNLDPEVQAGLVRRVKKFESGMVVNPLTIHPQATLADALALMQENRISGVPVVEGKGKPGRLVGILTNRDVRFATDPRQTVAELMTKDRLVTVREGVGQDEAKRLLHQHRIEKLLVVDDQYRCVGLITVKDIEKAVAHPHSCKDDQGRLRVAAATTVGEAGYERTERLVEAGVDLVVVDTAHGHSRRVLDSVRRIKLLSNAVQVVAGNIATAEGAKALIDAGAELDQGRHRARLDLHHQDRRWGRRTAAHRHHGRRRGGAADRDAGHRRWRHQILRRPRQGDRGRRRSCHGGLAARRHRRDAGRGVPLPGPLLQGLSRHGLGRRHVPRLRRSLFPAGHQGQPEAGARGHRGPGAVQGPGRERVAPARRRPACRHGLCRRPHIAELHEKAQFVRISSAGLRESHVHDVTITRESPNYPGRE